MNANTALSYDDVLLKPRYSKIKSRRNGEISLSSCLSDSIQFTIPIIAAPMDTICEHDMAIAMSELGGFGIIHRFLPIHVQVRELEQVINAGAFPAAAIGVAGDSFERATDLVRAGAKLLCIDVAHADHILVEEMIPRLKAFPIHIMVGNVATDTAYRSLVEWGADSVKCGIGGGSICTTRIQTGFGVPVFQSVLDCARLDYSVPIIADGGIRKSGDIVKALAAGAGFVIIGRLLAGTEETPGRVFTTEDGRKMKHYTGMAAVAPWRKSDPRHIEGVSTLVKARGSVKEVVAELLDGIVSGFSYNGSRNLDELQRDAEFIVQTQAGQVESSPHIFYSRE